MGILAIIGATAYSGVPLVGVVGAELQETTSLDALLETTTGLALTET